MKETYRIKYLEVRKNIKNKKILDQSIYQKVIDNKHIKNCQLILIYVSIADEIDTTNLIKYFLMNNKSVAVPKIIGDEMRFYYIENFDELKPGYFNILEPISNREVTDFNNCVSITPGICFSKDKYRLGYGKGFYDKFYKKHPNIYKIGLCYQECYLEDIPHNKHDIKVDEIIMT